MIEKNIERKLANRISYQIRYNDAQKESLVEGVQICEGGSISANVYMDGGVQIRGGFQICCDAGAKCP